MDKIGFIFPGQGSQYVGMGKDLYKHNKEVRDVFDLASETLEIDVRELCFNTDIEVLSKPENAQVAILTVSYSQFLVFNKKFNIQPSYLGGHSLGEITALTCAGAIDFKDAVWLVRERGKLIQGGLSEQGAMVAIMGLTFEEIQDTCCAISRDYHRVEISNYNSPEQITISGHTMAIEEAVRMLEGKGGLCLSVNVDAPYHSSLMQPISEPLKAVLKKIEYKNTRYPVFTNVTGSIYKSCTDIPDTLSEQVYKRVLWHDIILKMNEYGVKTMIELGPQGVLRNVSLTNEIGYQVFALDDRNDKNLLTEFLGKTEYDGTISAEARIQVVKECLKAAICTKNRNSEEQDYKSNVIVPYQILKEMLNTFEKNSDKPSYFEVENALRILKKIMEYKKVSKKEQNDRFKQILYRTGAFDVYHNYINAL